MTTYTINLKQADNVPSGVLRWCLDFPRHADSATAQQLTEDGLLVQGWLLTTPGDSVELYFNHGAERQVLPLSRNRPDVIKAILRAEPEQHAQLRCGFRCNLPLNSPDFELGVIVDGQGFPLVTGSVDGPFKVLAGTEGWLFLDNDTNKSVEQYTGKLLLSSDEQQKWQSYFAGLHSLAEKMAVPYAMLMAPAKEAVYWRYYPYPKAITTAIDQLLAVVPADCAFIYPVTELQQLEQRSFRVTDTHWSAPGARLASIILARHLGIEKDAIENLFAQDSFRTRESAGDLGNKIFPPARFVEAVLRKYNYRKFIIYDNQLPNFGRVIGINNPDAMVAKHCLVFGSSSSYSMLDYLSRVFSQLTLVHSAGNVDVVLTEKIKPDYLVTQTNARFVVRAPNLSYSLHQSIGDKAELIHESTLTATYLQAAAQAAATPLAHIAILHEVYVTAIKAIHKTL